MTPYILTFYFFFILALNDELKIFLLNKKKIFYLKILIFFYLIIYIGLRDNVGGDWGNYFQNYFLYKLNANLNFIEYLKHYVLTKDPLFHFINYIVVKIFPSYHLVNLICAFIFVYCLTYFCFELKNPFLVLLISSPYLITVVAMGYHRQALALAFFMAGVIQLEKNNFNKYYFFIFIAFCFHYTSLFLIVFGLLANPKFNLKHFFFAILFVGIAFIAADPVLLNKIIEVYILNPVLISKGAFMRILLCLITAIIFFRFNSHPNFEIKNKKLFYLQSYLVLAFIVSLIFFPNLSTLIDRLAIYFIPFQLIIISNFLNIFSQKDYSRFLVFLFISLAYLSILLVWVYLGEYSHWWYPYSNLLFI